LAHASRYRESPHREHGRTYDRGRAPESDDERQERGSIATVISCTVDSAQDFIFKINGGVQALEDAATGVISDLVMNKTLEELTTMKLAHELSKDVRAFAKPWGVYVRQVQISDFTPMKSFRLLQSQNHYYPPAKEF
jgi:hypothetical protein